MATKVKKNKIIFKGKIVSIGIDMHKHSWRITALIEGDIVMTTTLARKAAELQEMLLFLPMPGNLNNIQKR